MKKSPDDLIPIQIGSSGQEIENHLCEEMKRIIDNVHVSVPATPEKQTVKLLNEVTCKSMKTNSQRKNIKIALMVSDLTQLDIAWELKVHPQYVCDVIAGRKRSAKVENLISLRTGLPVQSLFVYRNTGG